MNPVLYSKYCSASLDNGHLNTASLDISEISSPETIPSTFSSLFSSTFYMLSALPSTFNILPHLILNVVCLVFCPILQKRELCQRQTK